MTSLTPNEIALFHRVLETRQHALTIIPIEYNDGAHVVEVSSGAGEIVPLSGPLIFNGTKHLLVGEIVRLVQFQETGAVVEFEGQARREGGTIRIGIRIPYKTFTPPAQTLLNEIKPEALEPDNTSILIKSTSTTTQPYCTRLITRTRRSL